MHKKQNVFDDFIACAEYLVQKGYTSPARLAIQVWAGHGLEAQSLSLQFPHSIWPVAEQQTMYSFLATTIGVPGHVNQNPYSSKDRCLI